MRPISITGTGTATMSERAGPTQLGAPWPVFRHDHRNTGRSEIRAAYQGGHPWRVQTGKGIFSTPVIDRDGTIYVGSADHVFYALAPDGATRWQHVTGEIIDSAAALPAVDDGTTPTVLVPSGDGYIHCLDCETGNVVWTFDARAAPRASFNNWFEANIALAPDGTIYAGNTNFNYYALEPDGAFRWAYETGANAWSAGAVGSDGTVVWGSNDTFIHAVRPDGTRAWRKRTLGFIAASAAIGSDGTVYVGSYDSNLYALDPHNGRVRWRVRTQDHVYSSAALRVNARDETDAVIFGSADGSVYAVDPQGRQIWRYDTGAPVRSSPALGRKPEGEEGWIAYVGSGNGKLYALDATTGRRRWSYDTTPEQPQLRDRNDLNGSPALGLDGVAIGGEHGQLWHIPYDYPLHSDDPRGCTGPADELSAGKLSPERTRLFWVTPGGNLRDEPPNRAPTSTIITLRLVPSQDAGARDIRLYSRPFLKPRRALTVTTDPAFDFAAETSADGRHLHIIPSSFLQPETAYTVRIDGNIYSGGLHVGNLTLGGRRSGRFSQEVTFRTTAADQELPLQVGTNAISAIEITRFAVPIPTMMPSLNQIGFDYMDWIAGVVEVGDPDASGEGTLLLWTVGGRRREDGTLVVDPDTDFVLPLNGRYRHNAFRLSNRDFKMRITGIPIPFNLFQLRGELSADLDVGETATAFADTDALRIPTFGPLLVLAGLASNWWQKLLAMATFVTHPYEGPANRRPKGIEVASLSFKPPRRRQAGYVTADLALAPGTAYPATDHLPAILLLDEATREPIALDYQANLTALADAAGTIAGVTLTLPAGTRLPEAVTAIVMLDVYPLHRETMVTSHE